MPYQELKNIIEAILLGSNAPLSLEKMQAIFDEEQRPSLETINTIISALEADYAPRALELIEVAGGYQLQTRSKYSSWVARMQVEKPAKYSRALLETLAIIAYKQPVTRADIEDIRGVSVNSHIMKTLIEREWIRIAGYKEVPGKPAVYTTTKDFLNYFNLRSLKELPLLPAVLEPLTVPNVNQPIEECVINE